MIDNPTHASGSSYEVFSRKIEEQRLSFSISLIKRLFTTEHSDLAEACGLVAGDLKQKNSQVGNDKLRIRFDHVKNNLIFKDH